MLVINQGTLAEINPARLEQIRRQMPSLQHRVLSNQVQKNRVAQPPEYSKLAQD